MKSPKGVGRSETKPHMVMFQTRPKFFKLCSGLPQAKLRGSPYPLHEFRGRQFRPSAQHMIDKSVLIQIEVQPRHDMGDRVRARCTEDR